MDFLNTPSRTRSKRVYDHSINGSPKNVENNSSVNLSTKRKLNFDTLACEVSINILARVVALFNCFQAENHSHLEIKWVRTGKG